MKRIFWQTLEDLVHQIPPRERLFVLTAAKAPTGWRVGGCGSDDGRALAAYGRDVKNDHGERLLSFATNCKLALTNTFFSPRKGGISHAPTVARPK